MEKEAIENRVKSILKKHLVKRGLNFEITNTASLITHGIVDSLGAVELVDEFEKAFKIEIFPEEMTEFNFDSVEKITDFLREKLGQ